jgi:hypothetical protein
VHGRFYFTDLGTWRRRDLDFGGLYYARADGSLIREVALEAASVNFPMVIAGEPSYRRGNWNFDHTA